jgi:hypothetical protein
VAVELVDPDGIYKPTTYFRARVSNGTKIMSLAGRLAVDRMGKLDGAEKRPPFHRACAGGADSCTHDENPGARQGR